MSVERLCLDEQTTSFSAFLAYAHQCSSFSELQLTKMLGAPEIEALLDFALNHPLMALSLSGRVTSAAMPSLTRLVSGGSLTTLEVRNGGEVLPPSPEFCTAVAAAPLVRLSYDSTGLLDTLATGLTLLAAVSGHSTLCHLRLAFNSVAPAGRHAVGAALGLLVAADSRLVSLEISYCDLGNDGLLPLIDALPRTTHLCRLYCEGNDFTQLTTTRLLAAVRAMASALRRSFTSKLRITLSCCATTPS